MRVTSNSYADGLINQLQKLSSRQSAIQLQISTGQRIQDASDDPIAAQRVLTLRDDSVANTQYANNIATHQDFAHATQGALQSLQKILDRVQEIAVSASGGVNAPDDLKNYGVEVGQLLKQAVRHRVYQTVHRL